MKVKFSGVGITDGRNKFGGSVASRNTFGAYIRNKVTPVNPQTPSQSAVRAVFADISQAWRDLSQAERDQWNEAVINFSFTDVFGDTIDPTGFNLHQQLNLNLSAIGQAFITTPPAPADVQSLTNLAVDVQNAAQTVIVASTEAIEVNTDFIIKATAGLSAGIDFVKTEFKQIVVANSTDPFPIDISTGYIAVFGAVPAAGTKVFVEMVGVNDSTGQRGSGIKASDITS